jgi:hypothetical protein
MGPQFRRIPYHHHANMAAVRVTDAGASFMSNLEACAVDIRDSLIYKTENSGQSVLAPQRHTNTEMTSQSESALSRGFFKVWVNNRAASNSGPNHSTSRPKYIF